MKHLMFFRRMKLTGKLVTAMVLIGLLPLAIASFVNNSSASAAIKQAAVSQLQSLVAVKKTQIETYFSQIQNQVVTFSEDRMIIEAMQEFAAAFRTLPQELSVTSEQLVQYRRDVTAFYSGQFAQEFGARNDTDVSTAALLPNDAASIVSQYLYIAANPHPNGGKEALDAAGDDSRYSRLHRKYHPLLRNYQRRFGFNDIFLVDAESGSIVYSVSKKVDYSTSLKTGPYSNTNFARAFKEALVAGQNEAVALVDFEPYLPAYGGPASFIASPVYDASKLVGVLVFQMPVGVINSIMQERSGLGESGETYLVGQDLLMRSQSRFSDENTILETSVETEAIINGQTDVRIIDGYRGEAVLSAFLPLAINGLHWGIIGEIDQAEALSAIQTLLVAASIVAGIALIAVVVFAKLFARTLIRPIATAVTVAERIAANDLGSEIDVESSDEIGDLLRALAGMQGNLHKRIETDRKALAESSRIKQALDNVNANVMVSDTEYNIIYVNKAVIELFRVAEADIRKDLPEFKTSKLLGSNIDIFHQNPAHQRTMLATLDRTHTVEAKVGGRTLKVVANPIITEDGERLGTVVEWTDRTQELAVEEEVQQVVSGALAGDLSQRIQLDNKQGFFATLSEGVNDLVGIADQVISDTIRVLGAMARGDLTETIDRDYQGSFGQLKLDANTTVAKLTDVVGNIQRSSESVTLSSGEIADGNSNLSQRTEEQAASLEETSSAMAELTDTVRQNAEYADQANKQGAAARDLAEKGGLVVDQAVAAMEEINDSSKKIADIIGVIDEIAFQTNLLALNASVEAARAGNQGSAFAVVAGEVRSLAGRSASAAKDIKELIQDSTAKVDAGSSLVSESGETLKEIVESVMKVTGIVGDIAVASREQSTSIDEVGTAISQMDDMTQQNAALVEEAAAASDSLRDQAKDLDEMMRFFNIGGNMQASEAPSGRSHAEVERRRSADRPWTQEPRAKAVPKEQPVPASGQSAANGSNGEWQEF